jgi:hypothetical protein
MPETKTAAFTFVKQGVFYFTRWVPSDLNRHYTAQRIAFSLRTRSAPVARSRALRAAQQLDEHWYHLRIRDAELPGKHMRRIGAIQQPGSVVPAQQDASTDTVTLGEAVAT